MVMQDHSTIHIKRRFALLRYDSIYSVFFFFFQAEDGIRDLTVTGVQTCALPIFAQPAVAFRSPQDAERRELNPVERRFLRMAARLQRFLSWVAKELGERPVVQIGRASCRERG